MSSSSSTLALPLSEFPRPRAARPPRRPRSDSASAAHQRQRALQETVDTLNRELGSIRTEFGRLEYMRSLWRPGGYRDPALLGTMPAPALLQDCIAKRHGDVFAAWLLKDIRRQRDDILEYLRGVGVTSREALQRWQQSSGYLAFAPESVGETERFLFATDLYVVLELVHDGMTAEGA